MFGFLWKGMLAFSVCNGPGGLEWFPLTFMPIDSLKFPIADTLYVPVQEGNRTVCIAPIPLDTLYTLLYPKKQI